MVVKYVLMILVLIAAFPASASECDKYIVTPYNGEYPAEGITESIDFIDLPLWIQFSFLLSLLTDCTLCIEGAKFLAVRLSSIKEDEKKLAIYSYIKDRSGCTVQELSNIFDIHRSTLMYHLNCMDGYLLYHIKKGRNKKYYSKELGAQNSSVSINIENAVFDIINNEPGINAHDVTVRLEISKSTIYAILSKLQDANMIRTQQMGRAKTYYPASGSMNA